jgi:hypothetical protein
MRDQLNDNPMVQIAVIGVLLVAAGIFLMSTMGGGGEEGGAETAVIEGSTAPGAGPSEPIEEGSVESLEAETAPTASASLAALPPIQPPAQIVDSWSSGATVVLLFVRDGGIDDRLVQNASGVLSGLPEVVQYIVPAKQIARYTAVTGGVGVERVPALVVLTPKRVDEQVPTASVHYGYQSPASIVQAVRDAGYEGPTLDYHP